MAMKIIKGYPPNPKSAMAFTDIIEFELGHCNDPEPEQQLNEVAEWIVYNFSKNFVILENVSGLIVGGWGDSIAGWEDQSCKISREHHANSAVYELRCYEEDAALFLLKWS